MNDIKTSPQCASEPAEARIAFERTCGFSARLTVNQNGEYADSKLQRAWEYWLTAWRAAIEFASTRKCAGHQACACGNTNSNAVEISSDTKVVAAKQLRQLAEELEPFITAPQQEILRDAATMLDTDWRLLAASICNFAQEAGLYNGTDDLTVPQALALLHRANDLIRTLRSGAVTA